MRNTESDKTFLVISQVYVPDPAAVGQQIADAAAKMVRRGYRVVVYTADRGYDDPSNVYPRRETVAGVEVRRLPFSSFGKSSIAVRLLAQSLFMLQAVIRGLFIRRICGVLVSTSPPFCGVAGVIISALRHVPMKYWLMDLNPDQMIAMNMVSPMSIQARVLDLLNRWTYRRANDIVVLDRFMAERVQRKLDVASKMHVMAPWPHEDNPENIQPDDNPFRVEHGLNGKFVVMYSGNHSPANPISTILDAAERMRDDPRLVVMSIGGGGTKKEVLDRVARGATNVLSLPYQPLDRIRFSLSAADIHVVSVGNAVVGIVHPCKVYGAMAVSRPILLLGPTPCHVSDIIEQHRIGWHIAHGDVETAVQTLRQILDTPAVELRLMGQRAAAVIAGTFSKKELCARFCDILERGL